MKLQPLSQVIEEFNRDKNPLEQLDVERVRTGVSRSAPKVQPAELTFKRTRVHPKTGKKRLPYRLIDAGKYVVDAVGLGATYAMAASYAGIHVTTFFYWLNKAERIIERIEQEMQAGNSDGEHNEPLVTEEEIVYLDFYTRLKQAEGEAVVGWLSAINDAAENGKWQAAAWMLERRHPEHYGKRTQVHQHHTRETLTVDEWKRQKTKRLEEAANVIEEFEDIEDVDFRVLGTPVDGDAVKGNTEEG